MNAVRMYTTQVCPYCVRAKALLKQRDVVAEQFASLPLTVGQSVTLLKNAGLQLLGVFDDTSRSTSGLAKVIKDLADYLASTPVKNP